MLLALCSCWLALACTCCVLRCVTMAMRWHIVHCVGAGRRTIRAVSRGKRPPHIATGGHCAAPVKNMELVVVQQVPCPCRTKNRITANRITANQEQQQQQQQQQQHNRTIKATSQKRHVSHVLSVRTSKPKELPSCPERAAPQGSAPVCRCQKSLFEST